MSAFLTDEGFFVRAAASGDEGVALVRQKVIPFSLALVDFHEILYQMMLHQPKRGRPRKVESWEDSDAA